MNKLTKYYLDKVYFVIFIIGIVSLIYFILFGKFKKGGTTKTLTDYIISSHAGLIRGLVLGIILGDAGIYSGIRNGAVFSLMNPLMLYMNY